jgi:Ca-activated chloride channel family protein
MGAAREPLGEGAMSFAHPELLGLAIIAPLLVAVFFWAYARRRRAVAHALADSTLLARLGAGDLSRFPLPRLLLVAGAAAALGVAAAGPRWGMRVVEGVSSSRSVVIAVDVSKSMLATDSRPNRLERERLFLRRLLREMAGDRIGLVVFAGRAYVLSPLTVDHGALNLYVDALDPGIVSQGGSSLAAALVQASDLARGPSETAGDRAVILLSDGEALEEENAVMQAADRAAQAGVIVHTVGVGTTTGSQIPELDAAGRVMGVKHDESGAVVISKLHPEVLDEIARRTGGSSVSLEDANATSQLLSAMGGMTREQAQDGQRMEPYQRQGIFVAIALLLLLIDVLLEQRSRLAAMRSGARATRAGPAAALLLLLLVTAAAGIGDKERGNRLYREGRYEEAVQAYQSALSAGDRSPELRYNMGTALLRLGRYAEAEQNFQAALDAVEPDLRERTFYNLGNRFLEAARGETQPASQGPLLDGALEAYRRALRLDPTDLQAKWNLEMALRDKQQQGGGGSQQQQQQPSQPQDQGGDASGAGQQTQPQPQPGERRRSGSARTPLTRDEADRVLSAVEQDERDLTREKLRKGQRRTPVRRDW